ncbi:MAG: hypothetical protein A4E49_00382 [Methanosaeta sp. PtaU1.Bin112]|nr:MAG: hypothetical protein A4E49_00382 [Methanosaeta sp. PtaU1.Bin112]
MITSNFSRYNIERKTGNPLFSNPWKIARKCRYYKGPKYEPLYPSEPLLKAWNASLISEADYTKRYIEETLSRLDPRQVYHDLGENAVLLCHESPGKFCHRRLVAAWLEDNLGIEVPEFKKR